VEPKESAINAESFEEDFRTFFKDTCTVKIDQLEFLKQGTLKNDKLIVDERKWK